MPGIRVKCTGNVVMFSQQGLEKLNDLTTKHFQCASNQREYDALKQVLEKRNRLELLEDTGSQRTKRVQLTLKGHIVPLFL